jgi:pimeloyl-ACP methyl ester carboxylesterase
VRKQYSLDVLISDWVVARGYVFAATDKGNSGPMFFVDGAQPGDAIVEWHTRVTELTHAATDVVRQRYGQLPDRTYITGVSNGGYLTRYALEHHPELYDGGVDWEGSLFLAQGPNLLTYLPTALRAYPEYRDTGSSQAHAELLLAGFPAGSEFLWPFHYEVYWDLTQRIYRKEFDPTYDGLPADVAGIPFCNSGLPGCDADYDYATRPNAVKQAIGRVSLTGAIGKPMLTLHGTLDCLLPIGTASDVYARLVAGQGRGPLHRYYVVEDGNHVDGLYDQFPDRLRPILPCYRAAFVALEEWVESGREPPASRVLARPASGDLVNTCQLT